MILECYYCEKVAGNLKLLDASEHTSFKFVCAECGLKYTCTKCEINPAFHASYCISCYEGMYSAHKSYKKEDNEWRNEIRINKAETDVKETIGLAEATRSVVTKCLEAKHKE